jgi:PilZ domain.
MTCCSNDPVNRPALHKISPSNDKRVGARFSVSTPVAFTWDSGRGSETAEGVTKDISSQSLFVWSSEVPPPGTKVCCHVFLPSRSPDSPPIRFDLCGPVVRTEAPPPEHHVFGFVVISEKELRIVFLS